MKVREISKNYYNLHYARAVYKPQQKSSGGFAEVLEEELERAADDDRTLLHGRKDNGRRNDKEYAAEIYW